MGIGKLKKGDLVGWRSGGGKTAGRMVRKLTAPLKIKGKAAVAELAKPGKLSAHRVRISRPVG